MTSFDSRCQHRDVAQHSPEQHQKKAAGAIFVTRCIPLCLAVQYFKRCRVVNRNTNLFGRPFFLKLQYFSISQYDCMDNKCVLTYAVRAITLQQQQSMMVSVTIHVAIFSFDMEAPSRITFTFSFSQMKCLVQSCRYIFIADNCGWIAAPLFDGNLHFECRQGSYIARVLNDSSRHFCLAVRQRKYCLYRYYTRYIISPFS